MFYVSKLFYNFFNVFMDNNTINKLKPEHRESLSIDREKSSWLIMTAPLMSS